MSSILSTPTIPISPSRPIRAKGKDADTQRQRGSLLDAKTAPQGVVIASDFAGDKRSRRRRVLRRALDKAKRMLFSRRVNADRRHKKHVLGHVDAVDLDDQ